MILLFDFSLVTMILGNLFFCKSNKHILSIDNTEFFWDAKGVSDYDCEIKHKIKNGDEGLLSL